MRVQRVVMAVTGAESWTVVDDGWALVEPVERYLAHLAGIERSPNTVRAYAHGLRLWFEFLGARRLVWDSVGVEDVSRFVAWLRAPADNVIVFDDTAAVRSAATVNRHLGALFGLYDRRPRRRRPPTLRPDPPTRHRSATAPPRHRPTDHVRTRRPHSRRVPVLALPPARPASRHRPTPPRCHSPSCPRPIT